MKDAVDPIAQDRQQIVDVIRRETQAFVDADFEVWSSLWVQDSRTRMVQYAPDSGFTVYRGWPEISDEMQRTLANGLGCGMTAFGAENQTVTVDGDLAWVVYDQWAENDDDHRWLSFETRVLERGAHGWRIVYNSFMIHSDPVAERGVLVLDAAGHVVRAAPEALALLADHDLFILSSGRLRARRRDWDKALQDALRTTGRYHDFFRLRRHIEETGGPFRYPAILGPKDDGGIAVAHLSVRDGATFLQVDGDRMLDRRLRVAQVVYGLSDGQLKIARGIADGDGLAAVATRLGISVNTARTHLSRLYDKTGVNAQTALVRLLLGVGN